MRTNRLQTLLLIFTALLLALLPGRAARADAGPKPSMHFVFQYKVDPAPSILSGTQYECQQADCADAAPLEDLGPQGFSCAGGYCDSLAYGSPPYHRIVIEFSDGVSRQSNVFEKQAYFADYLVTVLPTGLEVEEISSGPEIPYFQGGAPTLASFLATVTLPCMEVVLLVVFLVLATRAGRPAAPPAAYHGWLVTAFVLAVPSALAGMMWSRGLLVTLAVELALGTAYALWRKQPLGLMLGAILLLNLLTQPALWYSLSGFASPALALLTLFAEAIVVLLEAGGIYLVRRSSLRFGEALLLSLVLNAASFGLGLLLPL